MQGKEQVLRKARGKMRRGEQSSELTLINAPRADIIESITQTSEDAILLRSRFSHEKPLHI